MKKQLCTIALLAIALALQAQEAKPVVIVNAQGKVSLLPKGESKAMELSSGAVVKSSGQLMLDKGAKAVVYCEGQFQHLKGNQTIALAGLCLGSNRRSLNFDYEFGNYMMAAVEMVAVAQKRGDGWAMGVGDEPKSGDGWGLGVGDEPKSGDGWGQGVGDEPKSGDGWGLGVGDEPKSGDGWGGKGMAIKPILPFRNVKNGAITFSWSKPGGNNTYRLVVMDKNDKIVHQVDTRDTFARVDLRPLNLTIDEKYRWKVSTSGSGAMNSPELQFAVGRMEDYKAALNSANASSLVKAGKNAVMRGLAEAIALETNHWCYDAQQIYEKLQQKQPDKMVRIMHSAFWMRHGFKRLAQTVARG